MLSCEGDLVSFTTPPRPPSPQKEFLNGIIPATHYFDSPLNEMISSLAIDDEQNIYVFGDFIGSMKGVSTQGRDIYLQKFDPDHNLLWQIHFHDLLAQIYSSTHDEIAASIAWSKQEGAVFITGYTKSSLVETNVNNEFDMFYGKISANGSIQWIKHIGQESALDSTGTDQASFIKIAPDQHPIISFQTDGHLFEISAGTFDMGIMKIDPKTGSIVKATQLGQTTLAAWSLLTGKSVDGSGQERNSQNNFDFDGNKIVMPFRTTGSLLETYTDPSSTNDSGYVVFNEDFSIHTLQHMGLETYSAWASANAFAGSIASDNQLRAVVVLAPNDYLFTGKTVGNVAEVSAGKDDIYLARYQNHQLTILKQFGQTTLPSAAESEQVRHIYQNEQGEIYLNGHTPSFIFGSQTTNFRPFVIKVDQFANILGGTNVIENDIADVDFTLHYTATAMNFVFSKKGIIVGANNASVGSNPLKSYIWIFPQF